MAVKQAEYFLNKIQTLDATRGNVEKDLGAQIRKQKSCCDKLATKVITMNFSQMVENLLPSGIVYMKRCRIRNHLFCPLEPVANWFDRIYLGMSTECFPTPRDVQENIPRFCNLCRVYLHKMVHDNGNMKTFPRQH